MKNKFVEEKEKYERKTEDVTKQTIEIVKQMKERASITNKQVDPFMNLSFVSLAVIGDVRLLPEGVFNNKEWRFE